MTQKSKILAIVEAVKNGSRPRVIINDKIFTDCYLENGMIAILVKAEIKNDTDAGDDERMDYVEYHFEYKSFMEANRKLESREYYNKNNGNHDLTATEYGYDHEKRNFIDCSVHEVYDDDIPFNLNETDSFNEYICSGTEMPYVQWLEEMVNKLRQK